jgi:glycosyltransferase involved in cell wall biosynthesis
MPSTGLPYGVSFLVTLYNKGPYVEQTLLGILAQELSCPTEIIICDDGSTDESAEVVRAVIARRPQADWTYFRTENAGPALATNRAARRAKLRYLKPIDADDFLAPGATRLLLSILEARPAASLAFGATVGVDLQSAAPLSAKTDWPSLDPSDVQPFSAESLRQRMSFGPSGMLFPADKFFVGGGCDEDIFVQDYSLALNLSRVGEMYETRQPVCYAPHAVDGRLNGSPQHYHDMNLAIANHLGRADLSPRDAAQAAARCLGRAIKFQRRHRGGGAMARTRWDYLAAKLGLPIDHAAAIRRSLPLFGAVRRAHPPLDGAAP